MINRRKFLKSSVVIAGGFVASNILPGCTRNIYRGKELFSFVQINDTHIVLPGYTSYPKVEEKLRSVISSINSEENFSKPDFVLFAGDIIHGTRLPLLQSECEYSKAILDELSCPYYTVVGNHEVLNTEGNPRFLNAYMRIYGEDRVYYSFVHKGFHFIVFNNSNGLGSTQDATALRNEWLKKTLGEYPDYPKFIVCHIPLASFREDKILGESFGYWTYKLRGDNTFDIIQSYSDKVIAVLNGHIHLTGVVKTNNNWLSFLPSRDDDIYHISPSGLASYPCQYAYYKVYQNSVEVKMLQVRKDLVTPSSNIHGRYYHDVDYVDNLHPSPMTYVCGNRNERKFSIPLVKSKSVG